MDKETIFHKLVAFTAAVHEATYELTKDVKSDEITPLQYSILEYLAVSPPVTLSQISECQHISMPNTSREIRKLSDKNLCEKFGVEEDRRKQFIRLTEEGQAMMDEAFKHIEARFQERIQGASTDELKEIEHALDVLRNKVFY